MKIGIEALQFDIPKIYVPIEELAKARGIAPEKLKLGLGLERMSFPDTYQDAVVFGANALKKLIEQENLSPRDIDRIYVGTESGVDGSKPIASYILSAIESSCFQAGDLSHTDVVDLTFACIGGVDALHNSIDFVKANPQKKAVVICTDIAKYDLKSSGEYTQGAGAIALLISANPTIMAFDEEWAVSTEGVFDFFKPRRRVVVDDIIEKDSKIEVEESILEIFKEQPVFDGQYSNQCYLERTQQAYFRLKNQLQSEIPLFENWEIICMHLPYCYQARRIFTEIFIADQTDLEKQKESAKDVKAFVKSVSKGDAYNTLVQQKISPTEIASSMIGNMYTASIFMGLLSALSEANQNNQEIAHKTIGFLAYGSGSKSKAFQGVISPNWREKMQDVALFETIQKATPISVEDYEELHQLRKAAPMISPQNEFYLDHVEHEKGVLEGARYYKFME